MDAKPAPAPTSTKAPPGAASPSRSRTDEMIAWIMKNQSRIESMEKGAVTFNVSGGNISVKLEHIFMNVN